MIMNEKRNKKKINYNMWCNNNIYNYSCNKSHFVINGGRLYCYGINFTRNLLSSPLHLYVLPELIILIPYIELRESAVHRELFPKIP